MSVEFVSQITIPRKDHFFFFNSWVKHSDQRSASAALNVSLLQPVAFRQIVHLIAAVVHIVVGDPHGDGVDLRLAQSGRGALPRPVFDLVGQVVHLLL